MKEKIVCPRREFLIPRRKLLGAGAALGAMALGELGAPAIVCARSLFGRSGGTPPSGGGGGDLLQQRAAAMTSKTWTTFAALSSVTYSGPLTSDADWVAQSPYAITFAWSGGDYDPVHRQMIIWGGGHQNGTDNGIYAFNCATTAYEALCLPDDPTGLHSGGALANAAVYANGDPIVPHTYGNIACGSGKLYELGGGLFDGGGTNHHAVVDTTALSSSANGAGYWSGSTGGPTALAQFNQASNMGLSDPTTYGLYVYDSVSNRNFYANSFAHGLASYDIASDTWFYHPGHLSPDGPAGSAYLSRCVDTINKRLWLIGGGLTGYYSIDLTNSGTMGDFHRLSPSGDLTAQNMSAPGACFSASYGTAGGIYSWPGDTTNLVGTPNISIYDIGANNWILQTPDASNNSANNPGPPANDGGGVGGTHPGTFGRLVLADYAGMLLLQNSTGDALRGYKL